MILRLVGFDCINPLLNTDNGKSWLHVNTCGVGCLLIIIFIFIIILSGVRLSLLVLRPLTGLLYHPQMIGDGDCGEIGGMKIGRGNRSTRRKPAPPQQIPHDQTLV
jgi:hypothetical protein